MKRVPILTTRGEDEARFKPPPSGEGDRASGGRSSAVTFGEAKMSYCREIAAEEINFICVFWVFFAI